MRTLLVFAILTGLVSAQGAGQAASLLAKGEFEKAAAAARTVLKKDATNVDAWMILADALVGAGEPHDAWSELETGVDGNPKSARLKVKLGDVFMKVSEKEQATGGDGTTIRNLYLDAERMYDAAIELDPKLADAYYGKAQANFSLSTDAPERKDDARKLLGKCLMIDAKHAKAHAMQAFMLYGDGNNLRRERKEAAALEKFRAAQGKYEAALALDKSQAVNFVRYGHCFYAQGKTEEAQAAYIDGLKHHPKDPTPIVSGLYYLAGKNWGKMAPALEQAVAASPKSGVAWYYLGYSHYANGATSNALKALRKAQTIMPPSAELHYYIGLTLEKEKKADPALAEYRKALKINPAHDASTLRFEALTLAHRTDIEKMSKMYEELLTLAPKHGWVRNDYALILRDWAEQNGARGGRATGMAAKRLKRSGEVYEEAAELLPNVAQIQSDTGLLFEFYPSNFDPNKAKRYFTRSLEISDYVYRDAFDGLNRVCRKTKDWELLKDFAESVVGAIERGKHAQAPVAGRAPRDLPNETPGLKARAQRAFEDASRALKGS